MERKRINVVDQLHCKGRIALVSSISQERKRNTEIEREKERYFARSISSLATRRVIMVGVHKKNQTHRAH